MKRVVPYGIRLGADGKISTWPIVHVALRAPNGREVTLILVIDSGATVTLLPSIDAEELGIEVKTGSRVFIHGVTGGVVDGYRHKLAIGIEGLPLYSTPVVFMERPDVPRILGREGMFPRFAILFDETRRRVGLFDRRERKAIDRMLGR